MAAAVTANAAAPARNFDLMLCSIVFETVAFATGSEAEPL
jgi:hypothetical protein